MMGFAKMVGRPSATLALCLWFCVCTVLPVSAESIKGRGTWETSLQARDLDGDPSNGPEAYYDTVLRITWLADIHQPGKDPICGYGYLDYESGTWPRAKACAERTRLFGVGGWRLPRMSDAAAQSCNFQERGGTDCGFNVVVVLNGEVRSELAHMYHVTLGNLSRYVPGTIQLVRDPRAWGLRNSGPFKNLGDKPFWLSNAYPLDPVRAWVFNAYYGVQSAQDKGVAGRIWLVHDGDIGQPIHEEAVP